MTYNAIYAVNIDFFERIISWNRTIASTTLQNIVGTKRCHFRMIYGMCFHTKLGLEDIWPNISWTFLVQYTCNTSICFQKYKNRTNTERLCVDCIQPLGQLVDIIITLRFGKERTKFRQTAFMKRECQAGSFDYNVNPVRLGTYEWNLAQPSQITVK